MDKYFYLIMKDICFSCVKQLPTINKTIEEEDYPKAKILDTYGLEILNFSFFFLYRK